MKCSRKLTNSFSTTASSAALGLIVLTGSVLLDSIAPAELVLELATLDTLELLQELDTSGTRLITAALELELVVARAHGDALDRDKGGSGTSGHDLVKGGDLLVLDLMWEYDVSVMDVLKLEYISSLTGLHSTFQPSDFAISHTLSLVTLLITFLLSGTTTVMPFSGVPLMPMKPEVENSSTSLLVALSKWRVIP